MPGWARPFFPAVPVYSFTFANTATMLPPHIPPGFSLRQTVVTPRSAVSG